MKESDDLNLEKLLRDQPITDTGFSERVQQRIDGYEKLRFRVLGAAVLMGGLLALFPFIHLLQSLTDVVVTTHLSLPKISTLGQWMTPAIALPVLSVLLSLAFLTIEESCNG